MQDYLDNKKLEALRYLAHKKEISCKDVAEIEPDISSEELQEAHRKIHKHNQRIIKTDMAVRKFLEGGPDRKGFLETIMKDFNTYSTLMGNTEDVFKSTECPTTITEFRQMTTKQLLFLASHFEANF